MSEGISSEGSTTASILSDITSIEGSPDSYRNNSNVDHTNETTFNEASINEDTVIDEVTLDDSLSRDGTLRRKRKRDKMHQSDQFMMSKKCKDQEPCEPSINGSSVVRYKIVILK